MDPSPQVMIQLLNVHKKIYVLKGPHSPSYWTKNKMYACANEVQQLILMCVQIFCLRSPNVQCWKSIPPADRTRERSFR
uniref:Uncharacterized protein n=1 Tax=Aegilops tauschii subsp. strangulata TaxID=200361 RepID=A0A452Z595_AEGTS